MNNWFFDMFILMKYGVIFVDFFWVYVMCLDKGYEKFLEVYYSIMFFDVIKVLFVCELVGFDCFLFMWFIWLYLLQVFDVLQVWGFQYVIGGVWIKCIKIWKLVFGIGYVQCFVLEFYIIGKIVWFELVLKFECNVIEVFLIVDKIEVLC